jgi:23S rRNA pseudouridine1911/1915/1917 synthase
VPTLRVDSGSGERIDRWLAAHLTEHSRSAIQRWLSQERVRVNGLPVRASYRVAAGQEVTVELPPAPAAPDLTPEDIPLDILFENADLIVINKPAGVVVHPAPGHAAGTLVHAILYHSPDLPGVGGELRPGIVHRLDKDTSGVMVVAKHDAALRDLQAQFKQRQVVKRYMALVEGVLDPPSGRIDAPLGRHPTDRKRQAVLADGAAGNLRSRPALTEYRVLAQYAVPLHNDQGRGAFSLVEAHPVTGRTHQIRVHFAWIGHPLVGDPIYGLRRQRLVVPRLFLHAASLTFRLPGSDRQVTFRAPLPPELQAVVNDLERASR